MGYPAYNETNDGNADTNIHYRNDIGEAPDTVFGKNTAYDYAAGYDYP